MGKIQGGLLVAYWRPIGKAVGEAMKKAVMAMLAARRYGPSGEMTRAKQRKPVAL
ncbi:MAG: hypothetical protein RugAbin2_01324 [Rugosibacter sp.]|nr:hypothetical protein [Rugosibacter sp.]